MVIGAIQQLKNEQTGDGGPGRKKSFSFVN